MTIRIAHRYRGPRDSANGGYAAGLLAARVGGAAEVTLRLPPPLDRDLAVVEVGEGGVELRDGEAVVAEARPARPPADALDGVTPAAVAAHGAPVAGWESEVYAECFVCGRREDGSGLSIHAGPLPGTAFVGAVWTAAEVAAEIVWAAIDCPGAYAVGDPGRGAPVLGRITAEILRLPQEGERCAVVGWPVGRDGRKLFAGTALLGSDGAVLARSRQIWIEPRPQPPEG